MSSLYKFETREQRIERMKEDNPGRPIELCTAVVDEIWDKKRLAIQSRIPARFQEAKMEDLKWQSYDEELKSSLGRVLAAPIKDGPVGLILCGPVGSGKTHAAYAGIKWIAEHNPEIVVFMANYPEVVQALRTEFVEGNYNEIGSIWDKLNNDSGMYNGLILLDDISSQKQTDFEEDKLMAFLSHRLDNYMPFILTTNVKIEDFKRVFGERLESRLLGCCEVMEFEERDNRKIDT